jgi:hypothetical protein
MKKYNNTDVYEFTGDVAEKNSYMREFMQKSDKEYIMLYNTRTEASNHTDEDIELLIQDYAAACRVTGIHYLTGTISPVTVIDYGNVRLRVGSITEQKINIEFITKDSIRRCGYFDIRFTDNCQCADYAQRLSVHMMYPELSSNFLPWLFDVESNKLNIKAAHVFNEQSTSWYQYKYQNNPLALKLDEVANLSPLLKKIKKHNDER